MIDKLFILTVCTILSGQVFAQPVGNRQTSDMKHDIGDQQVEKKDAYTALEWYMSAYEHDDKDEDAVYKIATTHEALRDYKQAADWYQKLVDLDKDHHYPLSRYKHAHAMKMTGDYDNCITEFKAFIAEYPDDAPRADYYKEMSQIQIQGALYAKQHPDPKEELVIENVGPNVNSPSTEGGAFPIGRSEIIYTSLRTDTIIIKEEGDEHEHAKIYIAKSEDGVWNEAEEFHAEVIQKPGFHVVEPTFNEDHSLFYFVRAELVGNHLENSRIYVSTYIDGTLGEPTMLDFNSSDYSCQDPALAVWDDKHYLIFSSNMEGGKGGMDLWYAELNEDGTTKQPLNFETVNTIGNEVTPYFDERDGHLYFSSDGHPGYGGWDIFRSTRMKDGTMDKVVNLGAGFNTYVDDFHFVINKTGNDDCYGYVLSNRPGTMSMKSETCCDDIFSVLMPERCDILLKVDVNNDETGEPMIGATVQLVDKATGEVIEEQTNTQGNDYQFLLKPNAKYDIVAHKSSHESGKIEVDATKETLKSLGFDLTKPMDLSTKVGLKELGLIVETYNKRTNEKLEGVTVVVYDASSGDEINQLTNAAANDFTFVIPRNKNYKIFANREGYIADTKIVEIKDMDMIQKMYLTPPPVFYNVYFDFDESVVRAGAADTLDMVLQTLNENPEMIVEVRGHTDSKGSDNYNDKLSDERANAAIQYLISKGISSERLQPKGLGETEPAADNERTDGSDNPEGRQLNRRVEFKIVNGSIGMAVPEKKN